jgi:hypothetical protein
VISREEILALVEVLGRIHIALEYIGRMILFVGGASILSRAVFRK